MSTIDNTGRFTTEDLQDLIRLLHNRIVRQEFNDVSEDETWPKILDSSGAVVGQHPINTPRSRLRIACQIDDAESIEVTILRLFFFYFIVRGGEDFGPPIYGIPVDEFQEQFKFRPQITLYFEQDYEGTPDHSAPVRARISFRLMNESSETITENELKRIGQKIKTEFGVNHGYRWRKGHIKAVYRDTQHGFDFRLLVFSEAEAREVIEKVLEIQGRAPDWDNLSLVESRQTFSSVAQTKTILGKQRKLPVRRRIAYVRFRRATASIWGIPNDVLLYDATGYRTAKALVK